MCLRIQNYYQKFSLSNLYSRFLTPSSPPGLRVGEKSGNEDVLCTPGTFFTLRLPQWQPFANIRESWGRREEVHSQKSLIDWMRRRDMKNPHFRSSVSTKFDECCRLFCFLNFNLVDLIFQLFSSSNSFRHRRITALFTNMWIVKLKSQLTIACVAWRFCQAGRRSGVAALARLYYLARPTKIAMPRRLTDDWRLRFSLQSIILTDLLGNKTLL